MCFVVQWQLHVSRAFLRQDGSCVNMPPLASASDAALLRSIIVGPEPSAVELRADPHATHGTNSLPQHHNRIVLLNTFVPGTPCVHSFQTSDAMEWLVADGDNDKALKVSVMSMIFHLLEAYFEVDT
jgi:hypothetical protein